MSPLRYMPASGQHLAYEDIISWYEQHGCNSTPSLATFRVTLAYTVAPGGPIH